MKAAIFVLVCIAASALAMPQIPPKEEKDLTTCLLCKTLIGQLENQITDPANEAMVAEQLAKGCELVFPNNLDNQNNCKNMIIEYLPNIIDQIVAGVGNPEAVCTALTLCP